MARPLRIERAGSWYHLTARGNEQRDIFRDDEDRLKFLGLLESWVERYRLCLRAYVLMSDHYHLLAETVEANLSQAMQWLNVSYSVWFNRRHRRVGHLLQGRFQGIVVGEKAGLDYASIAGALRRLKERSDWDKQLARFLRQATTVLSNAKT